MGQAEMMRLWRQIFRPGCRLFGPSVEIRGGEAS